MPAIRVTHAALLLFATTWTLAAPAPAPVACRAGDWPMWHHDAARSSASPDDLPETLHLQWTRELPAARPAWPASQTTLQFDVSYEPVVLGRRMFVGSNVNDSITAYDTRSGDALWRFYTDGPVRFAPAAANGRVYACSDDGYLYCLDAETGKQLWRVNGGPAVRPIIGNHRLVSSWPARGGVVLADGIAYFAASIWPSMGIFIHAVDAVTGGVLWTNSETGALFITHPHGADSFGSVCPQGSLAVAGNHLIVPGGRTLPAVFNRATGKLEHFNFGGKGGGGFAVIAAKGRFVVGRSLVKVDDGKQLTTLSAQVLSDGWLIGSAGGSGPIVSQTVAGDMRESTSLDRKGRLVNTLAFVPRGKHSFSPAGPSRLFLKAGRRLYAAGENGHVAAYEYLAAVDSKEKQVPVWSAQVGGEVWNMLAADDRLFVVTRSGAIHCFAAENVEPTVFGTEFKQRDGTAGRLVAGGSVAGTVKMLRTLCGSDSGYAIALGIGPSPLIGELLSQTQLHIVAVDANRRKVERLRRAMDTAGLYGVRVAALVEDPLGFPFPPYMASLIVCEPDAVQGVAAVKALFKPLRPYGGTACLRMGTEEHAAFIQDVETAGLQKAEVSRHGEWTVLKRVGALPDAGVWTHQYGDASNSVVSADKRVKAPLGVLWFGGPSNDRVLPRHGHGPSPQVVGGRLFIEGADMLRCVDVYTGRVWWERELPGLGKFYDNVLHQPGAGEIGSNYVSLVDHVYVVYRHEILALDATTGATTRRFTPNADADGNKPYWGFIAAAGNLLVATSSPVTVEAAAKPSNGAAPPGKPVKRTPAAAKKLGILNGLLTSAQFASASRRLVVFDRHTGETLWSRQAEFNFRHNCICIADGKLFCIDGMSPQKLNTLRRRGLDIDRKAKLYAFDAHTGSEIWSTSEDVFGTFLNYSVTHGVLVQAGSAYRDRAKDEVGMGIVAYHGSDGKVLWKDRNLKYQGPCLLWRDKIITNGRGGFQLELLTGKPTGWKYRRMYGCNTVVGSENLLTFRSGAAGFYDLAGDSGTGNLGGFKSSCTSTLIVADGVLNAPDYTRTCTCAYQNQTSLAMIHMPEAELWTYGAVSRNAEQIDRIGLNFGAPGDRRDNNGTLWLDYPSVGGPSPTVDLTIAVDKPRWFRRHSSLLKGDGPSWVAASGGIGIRSVTLKLGKSNAPRRYTIRLHFSEPDDLKPGGRVFSVSLQGKPVLQSFDVVKAAGGRNRAVVKQFTGVDVVDTLNVTLRSLRGKPPLLSGIEVVRAAK